MLVGPHPHSLARLGSKTRSASRPQALVRVKGCFDASMRPQAGPSLTEGHRATTAEARCSQSMQIGGFSTHEPGALRHKRAQRL